MFYVLHCCSHLFDRWIKQGQLYTAENGVQKNFSRDATDDADVHFVDMFVKVAVRTAAPKWNKIQEGDALFHLSEESSAKLWFCRFIWNITHLLARDKVTFTIFQLYLCLICVHICVTFRAQWLQGKGLQISNFGYLIQCKFLWEFAQLKDIINHGRSLKQYILAQLTCTV